MCVCVCVCVQVVVKDIHVRYEDSVTKPGITMSAGATLDSLEVKVKGFLIRILGKQMSNEKEMMQACSSLV